MSNLVMLVIIWNLTILTQCLFFFWYSPETNQTTLGLLIRV